MAYENFIPTVWAEAINRELEKALVYAEGCNRQYDGEVKAMGDTVRILGVGRPTITTTTDKAITLLSNMLLFQANRSLLRSNSRNSEKEYDR